VTSINFLDPAAKVMMRLSPETNFREYTIQKQEVRRNLIQSPGEV
jgi:hypothetical protein